ncbi:MAG: helix-turn-helix transcriptional regulator [Planctomycetaceae bacterium]
MHRIYFLCAHRSYQIEIEFYGTAAETVRESRWHPNQKFTSKPDGRTVMSLSLRSLYEIKSWVLSFGSQARVLKPSLLVRMVREELQSAAKLYRQKNDTT